MRVIVLGGANTVWEDLAEASNLGQFDAVVAVNDIGVAYAGELAAWVSLHPSKLPRWIAKRRENGFAPAQSYWAHKGPSEGIAATLPGFSIMDDTGGSSGLLAVRVALAIGATHVVLCGVPMDADKGHFFDQQEWKDAWKYRDAWLRMQPEMSGQVRSMSGWTRSQLGAPDKDWLRS